jgi:hypothetical protein
MKWTEQKVIDHVAQHNGPELVILIKQFLKTLDDDELFKFGRGDDFPSIKIFHKNLSEHYQIIGIEFYRPGTSEEGFAGWVNLKPHEDNNKKLIRKIRNYLGEYKKEYPWIEAESPSKLLLEIRSILQIIHVHFQPVSP